MLPRLEKSERLQKFETRLEQLKELPLGPENFSTAQRREYADDYYNCAMKYLLKLEGFITNNWEDEEFNADKVEASLKENEKELLGILQKALQFAPDKEYAVETEETIKVVHYRIQYEFPFLLAIKKGDEQQIKKLALEKPELLSLNFESEGFYLGYSLAAFLIAEDDLKALKVILSNIDDEAKKTFCSTNNIRGGNNGLSPLIIAGDYSDRPELVRTILPYSDVNFVMDEGKYKGQDALTRSVVSPCNVQLATLILNDPRLTLSKDQIETIRKHLRSQNQKKEVKPLLQLFEKIVAGEVKPQSLPIKEEKQQEKVAPMVLADEGVAEAAAAAPVPAKSVTESSSTERTNTTPASEPLNKKQKSVSLKTNTRTTTVENIKFYFDVVRKLFNNPEDHRAKLISDLLKVVEIHQALDHDECKVLLNALKKELMNLKSGLESQIKSLEKARDALSARKNSEQDEAFIPLIDVLRTRSSCAEDLSTHIQHNNAVVQQIVNALDICTKEWLVVPTLINAEKPQPQSMQIDSAGGSANGGAAAEAKVAERSSPKPMDSNLGKRHRSDKSAEGEGSTVTKQGLFAAQAAVAAAHPAASAKKDKNKSGMEPG